MGTDLDVALCTVCSGCMADGIGASLSPADPMYRNTPRPLVMASHFGTMVGCSRALPLTSTTALLASLKESSTPQVV